MPVRIRIDVNGRDQRTYWIGRISGDTHPDSENIYIIARGEDQLEGWNHPGVKFSDFPQFKHRYGDGLEACVQRGLAAWMADD